MELIKESVMEMNDYKVHIDSTEEITKYFKEMHDADVKKGEIRKVIREEL